MLIVGMSGAFNAADIFFSEEVGIMEQMVQITRLPRSEYCEKLVTFAEKWPGATPQLPFQKLTKYVSKRLVTNPSVPVPECVTCGACCMYARIVPMDRVESQPIREYWDITLDGAEDLVVERVLPLDPERGHCVNLGGTIGVEVGCRIYPDRPHVCRDFEAGSDRCHGYRRMAGIEPPLNEIEVEDALHKIFVRGDADRIEEIRIQIVSTVVSVDRRAPEGEQVRETRTATIVAEMQDGELIDLHTYDTAAEEWLEHELEARTLAEARELIEKRKAE